MFLGEETPELQGEKFPGTLESGKEGGENSGQAVVPKMDLVQPTVG